MKKLALIGMPLAFLVSLSGCELFQSPNPNSTGSPGSVLEQTITVNGTKGLILAELAYSSANAIAQQAVQAGLLKGDDARQARNLNIQITAALEAANGALTATAQADAVQRALDGIADLKMLVEATSGTSEEITS